jgi:hypothetical protein
MPPVVTVDADNRILENSDVPSPSMAHAHWGHMTRCIEVGKRADIVVSTGYGFA